MIRLSPTARPEAWHTIEVNIDGDDAEMKVKYHLLDKKEAATWSSKRLHLAKAVRTDDEAKTFDLLLDDLAPEQLVIVDELLRQRIIAWDLFDDDAKETLPVNQQTLDAILAQTRFWRPLFQGLIDASSGIAAKKTDATGSTGGSTTNKRG